MKTAEREYTEECGLTLNDVAVSAARVYSQVLKTLIDEEHPGWEAVARHAIAMFGEGEEELSLSLQNFAVMLRKAYVRAGDPEAEIGPLEAIPRAAQVAWEMVARHMANVCNFDDREARRLEMHEAQIIKMGHDRLGTTP